MDEATRQRIFEPFFTTKAEGKGTGLGMPVVYGLMQSHNGVIDIQSELGKGTSISAHFPIPDNLTSLPVRTSRRNRSRRWRAWRPMLIVDDEVDVIYFLEIILQSHGYRVLSAHTAEEALAVFQAGAGKIQLVFSDIGLPGSSMALVFCSAVRKLRPGVKTILASGYVDAAIKTRMVEQGIDGFISKPYDVTSLLQTLRATLDKEPVTT